MFTRSEIPEDKAVAYSTPGVNNGKSVLPIAGLSYDERPVRLRVQQSFCLQKKKEKGNNANPFIIYYQSDINKRTTCHTNPSLMT
jgi:hypothetical protein